MREIFVRRGKRVDNGKWVYGNIVFTRSGRAFLLEGSFFSGESHEGDFKHGEIYGTEVIPETVGPHTGLTDKNGKSIFEGDIVRLTFSGAVGKIICDINYSIYFNLFGRVVDKLLTDYHCEDIEVIGNETDNPELLKGE